MKDPEIDSTPSRRLAQKASTVVAPGEAAAHPDDGYIQTGWSVGSIGHGSISHFLALLPPGGALLGDRSQTRLLALKRRPLFAGPISAVGQQVLLSRVT